MGRTESINAKAGIGIGKLAGGGGVEFRHEKILVQPLEIGLRHIQVTDNKNRGMSADLLERLGQRTFESRST